MARIRFRIMAVAAFWVVFLLFSGAELAWSRSVDQTAIKIEGVPNWGRVTDMLYRGGQPTLAGFKALQQMGVAIIVNFRDESGEITTEQREVESVGIRYVSIPWSGSADPSSSQVVQFLDLVRANPRAKIFVHCKRGADRTGVMIAAYRIAVEHKTATDADSEMHQFHYDHFWLPQLERYVNSLPQLLRGNPLFSAYTSMPSLSSAQSAVGPADARAAESPTLIQ